MKRFVLVVAVAALFPAAVSGQTQGKKPAPAPATKEEPRAGEQKQIVLVQGPGQAGVKEDARHCLEYATNIEIIKCAEPYLTWWKKR